MEGQGHCIDTKPQQQESKQNCEVEESSLAALYILCIKGTRDARTRASPLGWGWIMACLDRQYLGKESLSCSLHCHSKRGGLQPLPRHSSPIPTPTHPSAAVHIPIDSSSHMYVPAGFICQLPRGPVSPREQSLATGSKRKPS